jgi:hypothetical protein
VTFFRHGDFVLGVNRPVVVAFDVIDRLLGVDEPSRDVMFKRRAEITILKTIAMTARIKKVSARCLIVIARLARTMSRYQSLKKPMLPFHGIRKEAIGKIWVLSSPICQPSRR